MLDYQEYTTQVYHHQGNGNGNGYSHLQGDWAMFYKVAKGFTRRVNQHLEEFSRTVVPDSPSELNLI